ncbi:hypothetical protein [Gemmatimonas sp.]|jgi:hypothetical protein|uniref:hypothetical protein n=1 Tax=Gemmatimonas sp. TaxID=1962908 RepID=UPI0037C15F00
MAILVAALMQAVRHDDVKAALELLHANPELVQTSIHAAALVADEARVRGVSEDTQARVVSALIDAGADPNGSVGLAEMHGRIPVLYRQRTAPITAGRNAAASRGGQRVQRRCSRHVRGTWRCCGRAP